MDRLTLDTDNDNSSVQDNFQHKFSQMFANYFKNGEYCDVVFESTQDNTRIPAHRMIVFTQIHPAIQEEESTSNFIKIDGVRGETLRRLIEFCYTGRIILTDQNNEAILAAATLLGIERVRDMCEKRSRRCLSVNNCLSLWSLAEQYNLEQLNGHAMAMIAAAFRWLADDGHIVHVRPALFLRLLANDNLCVLDEEDIYCAVIQWVKFNEELRKSVFPELMTLVRVEHLTISFFSAVVKQQCVEWSFERFYVQLLQQRKQLLGSGMRKRRCSSIRPGLLYMKCNTIEGHNFLALNKYDYLERKWSGTILLRENCQYKSSNMVQVDEYLYIIGEYDCNVFEHRNTTKRLNLKTWHLDNLSPPMCGPYATRSKVVHWNGYIYSFSRARSKMIVERYIIAADSWSEITPLNISYTNYTAVVFYNFLFIIGNNRMEALPTMCYQFATKSWQSKASLPHYTDLNVEKAFVLNGNLYVFAGTTSSTYQIFAYDYVKDEWIAHLRFHTEFNIVDTIVIDDKLHVFGRYRLTNGTEIKILDVFSYEWRNVVQYDWNHLGANLCCDGCTVVRFVHGVDRIQTLMDDDQV